MAMFWAFFISKVQKYWEILVYGFINTRKRQKGKKQPHRDYYELTPNFLRLQGGSGFPGSKGSVTTTAQTIPVPDRLPCCQFQLLRSSRCQQQRTQLACSMAVLSVQSFLWLYVFVFIILHFIFSDFSLLLFLLLPCIYFSFLPLSMLVLTP